MKYLIDLLTLLGNKPFTSGCKVNIVLIMSQIDPIGDLHHLKLCSQMNKFVKIVEINLNLKS